MLESSMKTAFALLAALALGACEKRSEAVDPQPTASAPAPAPISPPSVETQGVRMLRVYGGEDGESHAEMIELPRVGGVLGKVVQSRLYATDVDIADIKPETFADWHGVSTPRLLVVLSGQLEIGLGDGSKHIMSKGDIVLAADTTGRGHTSRSIGDDLVRVMTVRLPAKDSLAPKLDPCPPGLEREKCVAARFPPGNQKH